MAKLHIFDHIAKKHVAYPAKVISTGEVSTEHEGSIAGENEQRKKKTFDVEYETAPAIAASEGVPAKTAKTAVMWGAHLKDNLAHWQGKTYFEPDADPAASAPVGTKTPETGSTLPVDPPKPDGTPAPAPEQSGPPKPSKK